MPKRKKRLDTRQLSIFELVKDQGAPRGDEPPAQGSSRIKSELQESIREAIRRSGLSRHQIAGEMSHLLDRTITKEQIDSWTREHPEIETRRHRHIPAEYLPAFCIATKSHEPLLALGRAAGVFVVPGTEALRAEIQQLDEELKRIRDEKRTRTLFLKELEKDGEDHA